MRKPLIVFVLNILLLPWAFGCELTLRVPNVNFPPSFYKEDGQWQGLSINITRRVLTEVGCQLKFEELPFVRGILHLKQGKVDLMLHLTQTAERSEFIYFIGPMSFEKLVFFRNSALASDIDSLEDFTNLNYPIAIQRGIYYGETFKQLYQNNQEFAANVVTVNNYSQLSRMLERKRISGFLFSSIHGRDLADVRKQFKNVIVDSPVLEYRPIYFGFSKKTINQELLKKLQNAYIKIKDLPEFIEMTRANRNKSLD